MGANEPKKKKRRVGKRFRPRLPRQKPRPAKLRPLTPWERDMAEEHHALVLRFLQVHGLSHGGLLRCGDLPVPAGGGELVPADIDRSRRLSSHRMGCHEHRALAREQERQRRIPQAVSLEEILPSYGMIFSNREASLC